MQRGVTAGGRIVVVRQETIHQLFPFAADPMIFDEMRPITVKSASVSISTSTMIRERYLRPRMMSTRSAVTSRILALDFAKTDKPFRNAPTGC
jgi:hypothetical protein